MGFMMKALVKMPLTLITMKNGRQSVTQVHFQLRKRETQELSTVTGTRSV
jgi:hypothetical protein